jgi:HSP20 family molecular chaperone IbpA
MMAQEMRTVDQQTPQTVEDGQRSAPRATFLAPADIYETRDDVVVLAEMPGLSMGLISLWSDRC